MQTITPFLWFDDVAEEAMNFYLNIFNDSELLSIERDKKTGKVFSCSFRLNRQTFYALNGGPLFQFTPAISFMVECETQQEIDHYWDSLTAGGEESRCGWLKDKFGMSWQIVPKRLKEYLGNPDKSKAQAAMQAMLKMGKMDIAMFESITI